MRSREVLSVSMPPETRDRLDKAARAFTDGNRSAYIRRAIERTCREDFGRLVDGEGDQEGRGGTS